MTGKWIRGIVAALIVGSFALPASAQQSGFDRVTFVKAVRDRDSNKVRELMDKHGKSILNAHDGKGDTALTVTIARRDNWAYAFLNEGANPNEPGPEGDTPLIIAARMGFLEGAEQLIVHGAKIDAENRMGETPLIAAVRARRIPVVRLLLDQGADPDKTDNAQGLSAREYAERDSRSPELLALITGRRSATPAEAGATKVKPAPANADDFKIDP